MEIISEATRRLPAGLKERHPEIDDGRRGCGHEYEGVDVNLIWHTVRNDLGPLRNVAARELEALT